MQHYIIASSNPLQKDKDRTAAEKKFVASRPAAGGESCNAGFYFQSIGNCVKSSEMVYNEQEIKNDITKERREASR